METYMKWSAMKINPSGWDWFSFNINSVRGIQILLLISLLVVVKRWCTMLLNLVSWLLLDSKETMIFVLSLSLSLSVNVMTKQNCNCVWLDQRLMLDNVKETVVSWWWSVVVVIELKFGWKWWTLQKWTNKIKKMLKTLPGELVVVAHTLHLLAGCMCWNQVILNWI